jgi:hypothetical protein
MAMVRYSRGDGDRGEAIPDALVDDVHQVLVATASSVCTVIAV